MNPDTGANPPTANTARVTRLHSVAMTLPEWELPSGRGVRLTHPDGVLVRVDADAVLGRKPGEYATETGVVGIPVRDPHRSVSRVHARLWVDGVGGASVADAGSGNGTRIQRQGSYVPVGGEPVPVETGDVIWLGDVGLRVQVLAHEPRGEPA